MEKYHFPKDKPENETQEGIPNGSHRAVNHLFRTSAHEYNRPAGSDLLLIPACSRREGNPWHQQKETFVSLGLVYTKMMAIHHSTT